MLHHLVPAERNKIGREIENFSHLAECFRRQRIEHLRRFKLCKRPFHSRRQVCDLLFHHCSRPRHLDWLPLTASGYSAARYLSNSPLCLRALHPLKPAAPTGNSRLDIALTLHASAGAPAAVKRTSPLPSQAVAPAIAPATTEPCVASRFTVSLEQLTYFQKPKENRF